MRSSIGHENNYKDSRLQYEEEFYLFMCGYQLYVQVCVVAPPSGFSWYDTKLPPDDVTYARKPKPSCRSFPRNPESAAA